MKFFILLVLGFVGSQKIPVAARYSGVTRSSVLVSTSSHVFYKKGAYEKR